MVSVVAARARSQLLTSLWWYRCILPRRRTRTASRASRTRNSRLVSTGRARIRSALRAPDAMLRSSVVLVVRPSPSSARRPSRPRRSPSDSSALSARSGDASSWADPRPSSSALTPPRTDLVPSSESSNASGKAPPGSPQRLRQLSSHATVLFNSSLGNSLSCFLYYSQRVRPIANLLPLF